MDWFGGKVSLDLAGAVNKLQESVKNIEKNFDNALGFEDRPDSTTRGSSPRSSPTYSKTLLDPDANSMGHKEEENMAKSKGGETLEDDAPSAQSKELMPEDPVILQDPSLFAEKKGGETVAVVNITTDATLPFEERDVQWKAQKDQVDPENAETSKATAQLENVIHDDGTMESAKQHHEDKSDMGSSELSESVDQHCHHYVTTSEASDVAHAQENTKELDVDRVSPIQEDISSHSQTGYPIQYSDASGITRVVECRSSRESANTVPSVEPPTDEVQETVSDHTSEENNAKLGTVEVSNPSSIVRTDAKEHQLSSASSVSESADEVHELEKVKRDMKMMEAALQGAARQAQAKADDIAKLMNENEQLKLAMEDLKSKSNDAEMEFLREEYHQRVATLERKVYALTKERDTLRREQNKRSDAAALLIEKDEIINQVMAEGVELSKKQAAKEAQLRKLRAQIRELEEEKKGFITKLQLEENKVESIKKDKAETEKLLQETIEKHQDELAVQEEYYADALNAAKEAEAIAEARASNETRSELEGHLREAQEREVMLIQALEELRQTLIIRDQQAIVKEDMLRRDIEDLQKRYQASERRCEELVSQLPESTRPLLRQIEAMQETSARKAEAWTTVERTLQSRLQEAEAKATAAEEREKSINERLSQTLSRVNVLEAQISCLRAEQTQLNRSLEKERKRAAENRQEYLVVKEEVDTSEGHANRLKEEIRELKRKHKKELQESLGNRELLQQELEREKAARLNVEKAARVQPSRTAYEDPTHKNKPEFENGKLMCIPPTPNSVGDMEKSFFLQASLDSSKSLLERRNSGEATISPYYLKNITSSAFEASLRQKEGELASYISRLASMESVRDSLAEELVKMTEQCEKLRSEAVMLPGIRAELEALRRRHIAALEFMGERDEELEELRADIVDLKEMYREQVNLLVNKDGIWAGV